VLVSMPARAFLLFGRDPCLSLEAQARNKGFNAREGIFAFRTKSMRRHDETGGMSFNAREGIFAFRTRPRWGGSAPAPTQVSMPARAFLLFGRGVNVTLQKRILKVSMPARAFLLFGRLCEDEQWHKHGRVSMPARAFLLFGPMGGWRNIFFHRCFNAREGIFAFRTNIQVNINFSGGIVSMPARAFLLFGPQIQVIYLSR